jgi:MFS family permease
LISGAAFTIAFSVSGVFAGQLVDRYSRRVLLGLACILWSASNLVTGSVKSFTLMVAMRFILGILQSFNNPSSLTLLADYFPIEKRSTVNSVQNAGIYIGSGLSSLGIVAIRNKGWRWLFNLMGALGILVGASILLFVKEPERGRY